MSQTEAAELPPQYSEYPTNTNLPSQFPIGGQNTSPLVNVAELQAHLRLLGAIHKLKEDVQSQQDGIAATNKEITWVVFVNKAVYRFFAWTAAIWVRESSVVSEWDIPPLDVIMVWHTYLLNPRAFFEDSRRISTEYCTNLIEIEEMPLALISSLIDSETLDPLPPSNERQDTFEQTAKLPYHISLVTDYSEALTLTCPFCAHPNQSVLWLNDGEKGYAQTQFEHSCEKCGSNFSKSNIGIRRFCEEITRRRTGERIFFPEILLNPLTGLLDEKTATATITKIFKYLDAVYQVLQPMPPGENIHAEATRLAEGLNYDHLQLSDTLHRAVNPYSAPNRSRPTPRLQRISAAYSRPGLASLDLVGAVLRQGSFIQKMYELGWTAPERFNFGGDSEPLVRSIARYHAFLDLMSQTSSSFLVPTLDIDLAWHTHQLKAWHYRDDTLRLLRRTPNHDDSVDSLCLSKGYDITAKAWKLRFGVPYSVCGCAPDGEVESTMSRFTSKITAIGTGSSRKQQRDKSSDGSRVPNSRPDLVSTAEDEADTSHPSEHNLRFGDPNNPIVRERGLSREKQVAKSVAIAKKGGSRDPWKGLQAERSEQRKKEGHKEAFTDPESGYGTYFPYWGVSTAIPIGFYGGFGFGGVGACGAGCGTPKMGGPRAACTSFGCNAGCGSCAGSAV